MRRPTKEELTEEILEVIQQNPGISVSAAWKTIGHKRISERFIHRILSDLDEEGLIERPRAGRERRLYLKGMVPEICLTAVQEKTLEIVRRGRGLSLTEIEAIDKSVFYNLNRNLRVLEEQHLVYTKKVGTKRFVYPQTEDLRVEVEPPVEEELKKTTFLLDEEIEVLRARGNSTAEISNELRRAGGRIESLIYSILFKYKVKTLEEAREKFFASLEKTDSKNR